MLSGVHVKKYVLEKVLVSILIKTLTQPMWLLFIFVLVSVIVVVNNTILS